ncbi:MAG: ABC transporter permease [Halobacteria archaeon]
MKKEDVYETLKIGYRNLWRNKLRSGLAMAAIIIGMFAILFIFTQANVQAEQLSKETKDNWIKIDGGIGLNSAEYIKPERMQKVEPYLTDTEVVRFSETFQIEIKKPGKEDRKMPAFGVDNPSAVYQASNGSIPDQFDDGFIVGDMLANTLDVKTGETVSINGSTTTVTATVDDNIPPNLAGASFAFGSMRPMSKTDKTNLSTVIVVAESEKDAREIFPKINNTLNGESQREEYGELEIRPGYNATNPAAEQAKKGNVALVMAAGVSVIVAALGILNVMLMNIVERRGEIGLLRAVGAGKEDILSMILAEAGILGVIGGIIGAVVAFIAGVIYAILLYNDPTLVLQTDNFLMYLGAVVLSIAIAVVSSVYPARKAANENPVEALRGK